MLFVMDIGNTTIEFGVFKNNKKNDDFDLIADFKIATNRYLTSDELGMKIRTILDLNHINYDDISGAICSSVVPPLNFSIQSMINKYFKQNVIFVTSKIELGLKYNHENIEEIGADRVVNVCAADEIYGGPAIIIDFGSATTFDVLSQDHVYMGGIIIPGIKVSLDALTVKAAKLPKIELEPKNKIIESDTVSCMQSGIFFSTISVIEGVSQRIKSELGTDDIKVIATGGFVNYVAKGTDAINIIDPFITMKGLKIVYNKISKQ